LVAGEVNYVTGRPQSLWSNVLVLPNFEVGDRVKLRGRSLEGAVLVFAHLRSGDFTGASLTGAQFLGADLREAKFECEQIGGWPGFFSMGHTGKDTICAELRGANFALAQLQGASLIGAHLQHAIFVEAQLQGAVLDDAQLQGAYLPFVPLQGASLQGAQLQGATLVRPQLQGTYLGGAQLQGANLDNAQLQGTGLATLDPQVATHLDARLDGASLRHSYVWRTFPPSNTNGVFVDAPESRPKYAGLNCPSGECDWSETSYAALKSLIENSIPTVGGRASALRQTATLEKPPYVEDEVVTKAWTDLAKVSAGSTGSYFSTLAKLFKETGCAADGAPYVIGGLIRRRGNRVQLDDRFEGHRLEGAEVATAFLEEAKCPGARGLSEENKAKLQEIRDRGLSAPAGPGTTAR
jgi:uncharacterized protein YjbI with pentapeptide repeats